MCVSLGMSPSEFWKADMVEVYWYVCAKLPQQSVGSLSEDDHADLLERFKKEVLNVD